MVGEGEEVSMVEEEEEGGLGGLIYVSASRTHVGSALLESKVWRIDRQRRYLEEVMCASYDGRGGFDRIVR
jgi:hypothetical protein